MVQRAKKTAKRVVGKKKTSVKQKATPKTSRTPDQAILVNNRAQWTAYKELQQQVDEAWAKLQWDVKRKANPQAIVRDKNELLLLLGECNYMASECMRLAAEKKKK